MLVVDDDLVARRLQVTGIRHAHDAETNIADDPPLLAHRCRRIRLKLCAVGPGSGQVARKSAMGTTSSGCFCHSPGVEKAEVKPAACISAMVAGVTTGPGTSSLTEMFRAFQLLGQAAHQHRLGRLAGAIGANSADHPGSPCPSPS